MVSATIDTKFFHVRKKDLFRMPEPLKPEVSALHRCADLAALNLADLSYFENLRCRLLALKD